MRVLSNMQTFPCCIIISFKLIWYGDNTMKWISFISLFAWVAHIKRIFPPLPLNSLGMSLKIYPVVILMLMRLFSRKHSRCCLASWRKKRRMSPLAGIRIFLACLESLCPKYVCFNISHQLVDSLRIYAKFSGQYLSGALLHKDKAPSLAAVRGKAWGVTRQHLGRWPQGQSHRGLCGPRLVSAGRREMARTHPGSRVHHSTLLRVLWHFAKACAVYSLMHKPKLV